jgi:hypothetical protein
VALREFTDEEGRSWRAWAITPESIEPVTRGEDYLADCFVTGWIVFETADGREKRRLCPWPMRWESMTDAELRGLLDKAELISRRDFTARHSGSAERQDGEEEGWTGGDGIAASATVRTFAYPGGRYWTVWVVMRPLDGGQPVLRFQAGARWIDLRRWPANWAEQTDEGLVQLLRTGAPREAGTSRSDARQRRWDDRPESPTTTLR